MPWRPADPAIVQADPATGKKTHLPGHRLGHSPVGRDRLAPLDWFGIAGVCVLNLNLATAGAEPRLNVSPLDFAMRHLGGSRAEAEPIAIIGAACRLPGAPDLAAFATLLLSGTDAVTEIPDDRWNKAHFLVPERGQRGKAYTFAAGVLADVRGFDPAFFGISPREAVQMDPQQRLALELAHEAIEDAGIDGARLAGEPVGVFVGGSSWDYLNLHVGDPSTTDAYSMTGVTLCSLSNRVSYAFDLRGPSFTVDTACSSSLVALHQACEAIRSGQVPLALVGGVSLLLAPQSFVGFCAASMLSPVGRCHAFDARADGYVRAEGGGFVMLKPLSAALAAGDPIRAVIRGSGVNSDGRTTGFSLPNKAAQLALLEDVYERFGLDPAHLAYVEAHGTGTPAGDPIEAGALGAALGARRDAPLPIGSVKTNIGHLEAASGMAGLLKAMLVAEHGTIPPSLHCATPNPNIPFTDLNLALVPAAVTLPADDAGVRLIGINSFGFGGTNAHAVLQPPPGIHPPRDASADRLPPLLLSARSDGALRSLAGAWRGRIAGAAPETLPALLRGLGLRREQHKKRLVVPAGDAGELIAGLDAFLGGHPTSLVASNGAVAGRVAFVFSGNGSQWAGMASDALARSAAFRDGIDVVDAALEPWLGWSVGAALRTPDADRLGDTEIAQPLLFAVQVALVLALRERGVEADLCMGHSVGEVAAAWACGALSLDSAARVIAARSRGQQSRHGVGGMAVVGLGAEAAAAILAQAPLARAELELAAHNSAQATTVAGTAHGLRWLEEEAGRQGWRFTRLDLAYAFHSAAMDPIRASLVDDLKGLAAVPGRLPFVSTVTGEAIDGTELGAGYWWRNVREPVLFAEAAQAMVADGVRIFIEIGPQPVVQAYLADALRQGDVEGRVLPTLSRRPAALDPIAGIAARCHAAGCDIRGAALFAGDQAVRGLPGYPWQREPFWLEATSEATDVAVAPFEHPLLGRRIGAAPVEWQRHIGLDLQPWLADHAIGGTAVMPAAALLDMALAAARARHPAAATLELLDIEIGRALVLEPGILRDVQLRIGAANGGFELASRPRLTDDPWTVHMTGRVAEIDADAPDAPAAAGDPVRRVDGHALYALAAGMGLDYGPAFRTVGGVDVRSETEATVRLDGIDTIGGGYLLPPNLTDGALQGLVALAAGQLGSAAGVLPWRFGRVRLYRPTGAHPASARLRLTRIGPRSVRADIALLDGDGAIVAELRECWFVRVALGRAARSEDQFFHTVQIASLGDAAGGSIAAGLRRPTEDEGEAHGIDEHGLLADAYVAATAAAALRALMPEGATSFSARAAGIAPESRAMLDRLLGWLEADGLATPDAAGGWTLATGEDLPPADAILRTLLFDAPTAVADAALLALAGEALPALLAHGPAAAPALPAALWDQFLHDSPAGARAAACLADAVADIAKSWPAGRPLRVLEIGARRGGFTRLLLRRLPRETMLVAATGADDLPMLAEALAATPAARAIEWLGNVPADEASFDLIVGLYPLTLGALDLAPVRAALAPGGVLLIAEPGPSRVWQLLRPSAPAPVGDARWPIAAEAAGLAAPSTTALATGLWPVALLAAEAPPAMDRVEVEQGNFLLFAAPDDALAPALIAQLGERGATVARFELSATAETLAAWRADAAPGADTIVLLFDEGIGLLDRLDHVARLTMLAGDDSVDVALIVRGGARGDPAAAALNGARRVLANEAANIACRLIRLDPGLSIDQAAVAAAGDLLRPDGEQEIARAGGGPTVTRIRRGLPMIDRPAPTALRLAIERPGLLDTLGWSAAVPIAPGAGELAIRIEAAGLNFRDVMWAMGLLPDEALLDGFAGPTLGLECAGIVTAIGPGVDHFAIGDRVMAFAPASLGTHTVTAAHAVMRMPAEMDFAAAATVPVAFLTVVYALGHLARIEAGERVLIHGGAGGVGLAAIQYAKHRGAIVYATAGSPAKRALLRALGVDAVFDSRSLAFADEVMRLTDGEGVDIVLNSLSGEAMQRSLALVKPFGRFLELGKRDFYENTAVGLRPFRHNVTYYGIDADQLPLRRPALAAALFGEIADLFAAGALRPLPHRIYDYADVEGAFRLMQGSGHIGKVVLAPGAALPAPIAEPATFAAQADGTYLVTGGLDGFGLAAARWLVARGARHLALLGRRGAATPGADAVLAGFAAEGVDARAYACDIGDEHALGAVLATIRADQAPLVGIVHAAVAMDDALLGAIDADRFARALHPKLAGAEALDRLTRGDAIALFLLFSSVTTPLGNPGQGNYVAANAAIEAVAERRHAEGLPALAVQWGPIGDAGYLAREREVSDLLARQLGSAPLIAADALDMLPTLLAAGIPVAGFAPIRWGALRGRLPLLATPLFAEMRDGAADEAGEVDLRALLATCTPEEARARATALLIEEVARIMKLAPDRIEPQRPLAELGMDSLMAVELRLAVEQRFGVSVPLLALSEGATLSAMAGRIIRSLGTPDAAEPKGEAAQLADRLAQLEGAAPDGPADGAPEPAERSFAAAASTTP